jgi:hypothetical protein
MFKWVFRMKGAGKKGPKGTIFVKEVKGISI